MREFQVVLACHGDVDGGQAVGAKLNCFRAAGSEIAVSGEGLIIASGFAVRVRSWLERGLKCERGFVPLSCLGFSSTWR